MWLVIIVVCGCCCGISCGWCCVVFVLFSVVVVVLVFDRVGDVRCSLLLLCFLMWLLMLFVLVCCRR